MLINQLMNPFLYINMKLLTSAAVMLRSIFITLYNFCHSFNCRGNSYKISILIIVTVSTPGNTATAAWRASVTVTGPEMMLDAVSQRKLSHPAPCIYSGQVRAFVSCSALSCTAPLPSSVEVARGFSQRNFAKVCTLWGAFCSFMKPPTLFIYFLEVQQVESQCLNSCLA